MRVRTAPGRDDPTSSVHLVCRLPPAESPDGLCEDVVGVENLIERVAQLKTSDSVPKAMDEASDLVTQLSAKVAAASPGAVSPDARRAFAELLTANSEMLHRKLRS